MTTATKQEKLSKALSRKLLPLALAIGFLITLVIPYSYYQLEKSHARNEATVNARVLADHMKRMVSQAPQLWKYQATKYAQMVAEFVPHKAILKICLFDEQNREIRQYSLETQAVVRWRDYPITGESVPILFNNQKIGAVAITVSGRRIVLSSLLALLICGGLGIGLAFFAYRIPLQVVSRLEGEIIAYQQSLEEQVKERTLALQESAEQAITLAEQARTASRTKSEFLANMSHELRTPLNHIIGFTELVVDKKFGPLNEQQEEFLADALRSSRHLLELINDILDISKVEAGKMDLTLSTVHLRPMLDNSLMMVKQKALKHRITISKEIAEGPETFLADERKLKQILYNLLSNAVKFTPDGGTVLLRVALEEGAAPGTSGLMFSISDTGLGVKAEDLERIFLPFEQGDNSVSRKFQGTGLGLALTKRFVELHDGRIWAESEGEGKGSRFHFVLPLRSETAAQRRTSVP
ncbi:MAG: ATP-binding protein [Deltaproteobacteria bacterium]|nr:ATP-binding protein [Deltaproteobacteria bacterium]